MSETLKFGNGIWATKKGSTLAYNDENGNFKPLPFTFDRSTSATRVNKEGLIEVVSNNEPRIDFLNDSKGALLLENSATNLIPYSEDFSNAAWAKGDSSVVGGFSAPDGTNNAYKLVEGTSTTTHYLQEFISQADGSTNTMSLFAKKAERNHITIYCGGAFTDSSTFNLNNGTSVNNGNSTSKIEFISNGWYKCSVTSINKSKDTYFMLNNGDVGTSGIVYQGDGTSGVYIWGAMFEANSVASSYIPTQGGAVTRVAETCSQTPPSGIIGQTEGTVYCEVNISNTTYKTIFALDTGSPSNFIVLDASSGLSPRILVRQSSGSFPAIITGTAMSYGINKIAFCYKSGDYAMYVNGVLSGTSASTTFPSGIISKISVGANPSYGYLSDTLADVKLYSTRLSNTELQALTS